MQAAGASPAGIPAEPHVSGASSWHRIREVIVTAIMGGLGVLIAGMTYAVQPVSDDIRVLREDVQILQGTAADVRERLATVEVKQTILEEGQADLETRMVNLEAGQAGLETRMVKLEAGQERLEEGQAKLEEGQAGLEARMMKLEEGQIRILALLERGGVPGTSR